MLRLGVKPALKGEGRRRMLQTLMTTLKNMTMNRGPLVINKAQGSAGANANRAISIQRMSGFPRK